MSEIKNFIGIDISKGWLDFAATTPESKNKTLEFRLDNDPEDIKTLKRVLKKEGITMGKKTLVTFEHIGTYSRPLIKYLTGQHCAICQESALRIKKSLGIQRGKTDKIDAKRILEYSIRNVDKLHIWKTPKPSLLQMKDLLSMRERFRKIEWMLKTPVDDKMNFLTKKYVTFLNRIQKQTITQVEASVKELEKQIKLTIESDEEINHKVELIQTIPGIGQIIAANLVCATRNFTSFSTGRQLACYAGCVPFPHSSGISVKGKSKVSQVANKKIKALIHLVALQGIRKNGEFRKYYDKKVKEGKAKMSVINAVRCKILLRVAAVVKRDKPYMTEKDYKKLRKTTEEKKTKIKATRQIT
jgi:transposase